MTAENNKPPAPVVVKIAPDVMRAWLHLAEGQDGTAVALPEVHEALRSAGVAMTEQVSARCEEFVNAAAGADPPPSPFLVAEGRPLVEGQDEQFVWHETLMKGLAGWFDEEPADYRTCSSIITVEKDAVMGTIQPGRPTQEGVDVKGRVLKETRKPATIVLDESVRRDAANPAIVLANCAGVAILRSNNLAIREVVEVKGDVDFSCGNIDSPVDVSIRGTVLDLFEVKSGKTVTVRGSVQAAHIEAAEDLIVRGGILGRRKGRVRAGGQVTAKYLEDADIQAGGDVNAPRGVLGTRLQTQGKLIVKSGAIIGGEVYAREGIVAATLGSEAGVPTGIAVGIAPEIVREAGKMDEDVKARRQMAERIRSTVKPLLTDLKRLTSTQKEKATELMYQADSMEAEIAEISRRKEEMLEAAKSPSVPHVTVLKIIHPRVRIGIGSRHVSFSEALRGPVRIEKRKIKGVTEFVAVNELSGSITTLPSSESSDGASPKAGKAQQQACSA